jgi:hypothetical protein
MSVAKAIARGASPSTFLTKRAFGAFGEFRRAKIS